MGREAAAEVSAVDFRFGESLTNRSTNVSNRVGSSPDTARFTGL